MKKRIRINNSVIELMGNVITVYKHGEVLRVIETNNAEALIALEAECMKETLSYIHRK